MNRYEKVATFSVANPVAVSRVVQQIVERVRHINKQVATVRHPDAEAIDVRVAAAHIFGDACQLRTMAEKLLAATEEVPNE